MALFKQFVDPVVYHIRRGLVRRRLLVGLVLQRGFFYEGELGLGTDREGEG
jgi:hypothetical protein